jgi:hypothetical protein
MDPFSVELQRLKPIDLAGPYVVAKATTHKDSVAITVHVVATLRQGSQDKKALRTKILPADGATALG